MGETWVWSQSLADRFGESPKRFGWLMKRLGVRVKRKGRGRVICLEELETILERRGLFQVENNDSGAQVIHVSDELYDLLKAAASKRQGESCPAPHILLP